MLQSNPFISVVSSIYKTPPALLDQSVNSVLNQTYQNFELILVDNGNQDDQLISIIEKYAQTHPKIRAVRTDVNLGPGGGRNTGIRAALGEYICFIDGDDFFNHDHLEKMLQACGDSDMVVCGYNIVNEDGEFVSKKPASSDLSSFESFAYVSPAPWNRLLLHSFLKKYELLMPESCLTEDIPFNYYCMAVAGSISYLCEHTYNNRVLTRSTSRGSSFCSMPLKDMPFDYVENMLNKIDEKELPDFLINSIVRHMMLLCCLFSRKSGIKIIAAAAKRAAKVLRLKRYTYLRSSIRTYKKRDMEASIKLSEIMFCIAVKLHMEVPFAVLISSLNNLLFR